MRRALIPALAVGGGVALYVGFERWLRRRGVDCSLFRYVCVRWKLRLGAADLLIIADFDRTISTARCHTSCHGVLESCPALSEEYRRKAQKVTAHYLPIETSVELTQEEKIPLMQEWYHTNHKLLLQEPITESMLGEAARGSAVEIRPGFAELLQLARSRSVPLLVCSAGLGNIVRELLLSRLSPELRPAEVPIVSNWLHFSADGFVSGFSLPLIHMFNKDGGMIQEQLGAEEWEQLIGGRRTALLLGDSLGDATMANGLGMARVCRIGFLNDTDRSRVAARLPAYRRAFDALLLGDISFEWVNGLLGKL